ncbi:MAG: C40 family peptidase [Enterobacteriaceae bacterium]
MQTALEKEILAHATVQAPEKSCGFVLENAQGWHYQPCCNIADTPEKIVEIAADDWLKASWRGTIIAVVHSHPQGEPWLSGADRIMQQRTACDWWLVAGGQVHRYRTLPPLLGRPFKQGRLDGDTLIRDAFHLAGIELDPFGREEIGCSGEQNLCLQDIAAQGFVQVDGQPQPGDLLLIGLDGKRANHVAIYYGEQTVLHHQPERLSCRETYNDLWQKHTHSLWRHQAWQSSAFTAICNDMNAALN